ncbi:BspA family leucine-rich repeat surface protein [Segatella copri]|uniref:BspA family leucine-rich repeat surface protein n=1 Tax=Segatella copri TaxID=165179 RepID=UPI0022303ECF|nr:BspA family leucine-rich repeat surface protein [Segatella copri]MCW4083633.1 BspA family leucine-rich repeat surface protein [Segatella copri]
MGGAKFCRFALFPLMLLMLLLVPTRMVAQTPTEDPRYALFNLDGITNVTITDNGDYPWQMMDLKAEGMTDISFEIPEGSTGLMSSNYNVEGSTSETVVNFKVEKPIFLTFKHLVSSESYCDKATITIDNKKFEEISGMRQIEIKESLSAGEHTLKLSYQKNYSGNNNADRTFIYDLKTATSISDNNYIAEYNAKNTTLTFKKVIDANISDIGNNSVIVEKYNNVGEICKALGNVTIKNIVFEESFKTYAPTSLKEFFYNCKTLETISGLEYLNTANITDMGSMFQDCYNLKSLDLTKFDTKNVSSMYFMFYNCPNLTSLDLTNFNTKNVKNMNGMFGDCTHLTSLDLTNFNTAKVTNMGNMFLGCSNLTSLDLTNFNTAKVTDMHGMFNGCSALISLDLTNFNTAEVRNMNRMFNMLDKSSTALTTIYVSDNFVTTNVQNGENMFKNCTKLKGFQKYSLFDTDHQYANYKTGYFTKLVGKNGEEKIGATGETLATENLVLDDGKDFVAYEPFAAKDASYSRNIPKGSTWGTLCLPFAIDQSQVKECKFYRLTGIDKDCITLESYEDGAEIPAGTPVLFKMNEGVKTLSISVQNVGIVTKPKAETNTEDVNLVGSFTKIGGNGNQGLDKNDYIIGKDKFWRVFDLNDGNGVGIKPMRAYIHPATASQARATMLSIGKGDGTTAIDNLNAISNDANAEYYDANGRRTNGLQKGLNIVKRGSKTYKIMVK